ncbi:MAG: T9SS type A sorting domain-containing protein [Bacteroidales bacterium]
MRKTVLLSLLILFLIQGYAQNNNFLLDSVRWELNASSCCPEYTWYVGDMISKRDTIINNEQYKIIGWEDSRKDYALRTDSTNKVWVIYLDRLLDYGTENDSIYIDSVDSWFYRLSNDSSEYLLYDFNVSEGDTIDLYFPPFTGGPNVPDTGGYFSFRVNYISSICVNDEQVNSYQIDCIEPNPENNNYPYDIYFDWKNGIGAKCGGPIYTESTAFFENQPLIISKVFQYGVQIYPCTVGFEDKTKSEYPKIYPNPVFDKLYIGHNNKIINVKIYSSKGELVCHYKNICENYFSTSFNQNKGLYLIKLEDNVGLTYKRKLIKYK